MEAMAQTLGDSNTEALYFKQVGVFMVLGKLGVGV